MIRGLYAAVSNMVSAKRRIEVVTENVANARTTGYKQDRTATMSFAELLVHEQASLPNGPIGPVGLSNVAQAPTIDLTQGSLEMTGRNLDLALEGPGFFVVQTPDGLRYTRDGSFTRDALGRLATVDGDLVLGENGPITLPAGAVSIDPRGMVAVDDVPIDRLRLVEFGPGQALRRLGNNQLVPRDEAEAPQPSTTTAVRQGFIEASNVDLTGAQSTLLELQRAYEASQRMVQYQDELIGRAVNDIARPVS